MGALERAGMARAPAVDWVKTELGYPPVWI